MFRKNPIANIRIAALAALVLAGVSCVTEDRVDTVGPSGNKVSIDLITQSVDYTTPETRANETVIGLPMVLVYSGSSQNAVFVEAAQAVGSGSQAQVTLSKTDQACQLVVLANIPAQFYQGSTAYTFDEQNLTAQLSGTTIGQLEQHLRTVPATVLPYGGSAALPLSGLASVSSIDENTRIVNNGSTTTLTLTRAVAKVEVTVDSSVSGFTVTGVGAMNVARNGAFYRYGSQITPSFYSTIAYPDTRPLSEPLYLYETDSQQEPALIISAQYNGVVQYYKLAFRVNEQNYSVQRNQYYQFHITAASPGYSTPDEAKAAPASNLIYDIVVQDENSHEIISNGQYYLGITNSRVNFYYSMDNAVLENAFSIQTNASSDMGITEATITVSPPLTLISPSDGKIRLSPGNGTVGITPVTLAMGSSYFNSATVTLQVGNLSQTVTVECCAGLTEIDVLGQLLHDDYTSFEFISGKEWLSMSLYLNQNTPRQESSMTFLEPRSLYMIPNWDYIYGSNLDQRGTFLNAELFLVRQLNNGYRERVKSFIRIFFHDTIIIGP